MTRRTPRAPTTRSRHAVQRTGSSRSHRTPSPLDLGFACFRLVRTYEPAPAPVFSVVRLVETRATMGAFVGRI
ncbi:MAG: hypothetical protein H0T79_12955 [Deltaproteobacteria bacterium]|nr:hypothetical protein [Deltaproteobacteria bacterium]